MTFADPNPNRAWVTNLQLKLRENGTSPVAVFGYDNQCGVFVPFGPKGMKNLDAQVRYSDPDWQAKVLQLVEQFSGMLPKTSPAVLATEVL